MRLRDGLRFDDVTYTEYLLRWREQHDACLAFFDADREERWNDFEPARVSPTLTARASRPALQGPAGAPGDADARWGASGARPHPGQEVA